MRADIAQVIGRYVSLRGRGQTLKGLCPFHNEKTPSFHVNPSHGVYYCFGCGKGGDVFNFVQEIEGVGFREALEMLAEDVGVPIERRQADSVRTPPQPQSPQAPPATPSATKTEMFKIHEDAMMFFYRKVKDTPKAVEYFKSRGLPGEIVKEFRLGYAPAGWSELYDYLRGKGVPPAHIVACGLATSKEGNVHDRFRNRVMFPLHDLGGHVIAFAGRGLDADTQPKYLNSPGTKLYNKGGVLYGMHRAREPARKEGRLLVVEGYIDYISLYVAGIHNVAAVSGTAFTEVHAQWIKRLGAARVTLVFDGDLAGLAAARRAAVVLAPFNMDVSILALPGGDDPDSFVRREGGGAFKELLSSARGAADFLIDGVAAEAGGSPQAKIRAIDELMPYARALTDPIVRDDFIAKLARRLRIDDVRRVSDRLAEGGGSRGPTGNQAGAYDAGSAGGAVLGAPEESFLRILMTSPELIVTARQHLYPEMLFNDVAADIYSIMLETYACRGDLDLSALLDACSNKPEARRVISMLAVTPALMKNIQGEFVQKLQLLCLKFVNEQMKELGEELMNCLEQERGPIEERLKDCQARKREWMSLK